MKAILINLTSVCTKRQTNRVGKRKKSYMKKYVAIYHNCAVRDAQICKVNQDTVPGEPWDDEYWQDLEPVFTKEETYGKIAAWKKKKESRIPAT